LSAGGTGVGIEIANNNAIHSAVYGNLVEGFSGSGGKGFSFGFTDAKHKAVLAYNAVYNCTTAYNNTWGQVSLLEDNETLGASPFAKSGSDTFANRFTYFAPVDTGNVHDGVFP
jgi:hypothetical protein